MNYLSNNNGSQKNNIFFMMFVLLLLVNVSVFGQEAKETKEFANTNIEMNTIKQEAPSDATGMNFILWFMGSKQSPNVNSIPDGTSTKRQFINSGTEPNQLLLKTFLKKAANFGSSLS